MAERARGFFMVQGEDQWNAGLGWGFNPLPDITVGAPEGLREIVEYINRPFGGVKPFPGIGVNATGSFDLLMAGIVYTIPVGRGAAYATTKVMNSPVGRWLVYKLGLQGGERIGIKKARDLLAKYFQRLKTVLPGRSAKQTTEIYSAGKYMRARDQATETLNKIADVDARRIADQLIRGERGNFPDLDDVFGRARAKSERDYREGLQEQQYEEGGDMPYNRRTGQWYPARRRGGYSNYRRGGPRRGGYGYGSYRPRRRTYRRW